MLILMFIVILIVVLVGVDLGSCLDVVFCFVGVGCANVVDVHVDVVSNVDTHVEVDVGDVLSVYIDVIVGVD